MRKNLYCFMAAIMVCMCGLFPAAGHAARFKVLVVMSYEDTYPWVQEIKEGTDSVLIGEHEVRYFYMDTKGNLKGGPQKAEEAYALYKEFQPDGVIAADDNAQSMFVVKYLKDKVRTPVMFCGVNAEAEKYGYPASNVSGILERIHVAESVALAKQLIPSLKTFGFMIKKSPTGKAILKEIRSESDRYAAKFVASEEPNTLKEAVAMAKKLREQCDALFLSTLQGIPDENGRHPDDNEIIPIVLKAYSKPGITDAGYRVKYGILCAVQQSGREQGKTAAKMLLKAMQGTPVTEIPITRNYNGKRIINVTALKALGILPKGDFMIGAELVKTEK